MKLGWGLVEDGYGGGWVLLVVGALLGLQ